MDYSGQFSKFIEQKVVEYITKLPFSYPCEVEEVDSEQKGFVKVKCLIPTDDTKKPLSIPVLRSPYLHLPIKKGDLGIALNCDFLFEKMLSKEEITQRLSSYRDNGLFFVPLVASEDIKAEEKNTTIYNQEQDKEITLAKDKIEIKAEDNVITLDKKLNFLIKNKNVTIDSAIQTELPIEYTQTPIEIKCNAGSLYKAFDIIIQLLDALSTGLTGPTSSPAGYQGAKPGLVELLKQIIKE